MKKLIIIIILLTLVVNCSGQDTLTDKQKETTSVIPKIGITDDSTLTVLKNKIENEYKNDLESFEKLKIKIIKEESYLEILNYLIEERKKK